MTRFKNWSREIAKRSCHRKACVAVARKLAVIMHAMWSDGTFYVGDAAMSDTDAAQGATSRIDACSERSDERRGGG